MLNRTQSSLLAVILVTVSIFAFAPTVIGPHAHVSCSAAAQSVEAGAHRFTQNSSSQPDFEFEFQAQRIPRHAQPAPMSIAQTVRPILELSLPIPPLQIFIRRLKLLSARTDSPDPFL